MKDAVNRTDSVAKGIKWDNASTAGGMHPLSQSHDNRIQSYDNTT